MPDAVIRAVDVYPYWIRADNKVEFLMLHRADGTLYSGEWRMVGGKIRAGETAWQAGLRELSEETHCRPLKFWVIPSINTFYEWQADRINLIPAFAAEMDKDPELNEEHDAFEWLPVETAALRTRWTEQKRLLKLAAETIRMGISPALLAPTGER